MSLLRRVEKREVITICKSGKPVYQLKDVWVRGRNAGARPWLGEQKTIFRRQDFSFVASVPQASFTSGWWKCATMLHKR
jgi:hypothetical protein